MIITFCGHAKFPFSVETEQKLLSLLEEIVGNEPADMYLGNFGNFDDFAYNCCKKYKETHPKISLIFITPYITEDYQKNHLYHLRKRYDEVIYPEIESKPLKFAISYRNKWMVGKADYVICWITHTFGGAYKTFLEAKRKGKKIFNISTTEE